jgi:hypothetical protein
MKAAALLIILAASGCARMGTHQTDRTTTTRTFHLNESTGKTNRIEVTENRETTTRAAGTALVSSSSTFEGLDASQNGRDQGLKVAKSAQRSDVDRAIDMIGKLAPLAGALTGVPIGSGATPPTIQTPRGMKWILVPIDDPSTPQPEIQPFTP